MQFYSIHSDHTNPNDKATAYAGTLGDAHAAAKRLTHSGDIHFASIRIYLVELPTDKAGIVAMLNVTHVATDLNRSWGLTARGGINELTVDVE